MFRTSVQRAASALALVVAVAGVGIAPADAASGASITPNVTWGTKVVNGKAQRVRAIVEVGNTVYLGGEFTTMVFAGGHRSRGRLAALNADTGQLTTWNPKADGRVWALLPSADGQRLYVGGDFNRIGGVIAPKLAALNLATGKVDTSFQTGIRNRVKALALSGDRLYAGGDFQDVGGALRAGVAALDAGTGALLPWTPPANGGGAYMGHMGTPTPDAGPGSVNALAVPADGTHVYVGGNFLNIGGQGGLLALDGATGSPLPIQWNIERPVFALTMGVDGNLLYAAAGGPGGRGYAFDPATSKPKWAARVDGDAVGLAVSATTMYLMGHYDYIVPSTSSCYQFCPEGTARKHLAAFDVATGALDPWNPMADTNSGPYPAAVGAAHVYIGGVFTKINGRSQPGFAAFPGTP